MKYYVGTLTEVNAVNALIDANANLPNSNGTQTWATPRETIVSGVYALLVPENGWNGYNYEQMTNGIIWPETDGALVQFPIDE